MTNEAFSRVKIDAQLKGERRGYGGLTECQANGANARPWVRCVTERCNKDFAAGPQAKKDTRAQWAWPGRPAPEHGERRQRRGGGPIVR